jgi:penicillin-binding protein 1A
MSRRKKHKSPPASGRGRLDLKPVAGDRIGAGGARDGSRNRRARSGRQKKRARGNLPRRFVARGLYWTIVGGIWTAIALACLVGFYAVQLPQMSTWTIPQRPPSVRIVDRAGVLVADRGITGGEAVRLSDMSPYIPMAVIAIEDRRFKQHFGIDPIGLARAFAVNLVSGRLQQGGSTLTQQLAKNLFLEPDRTVGRKIQEAVLALWLETRFTKDEILELYLNRVYFGTGAYGIDAAARRYFDTPPSQVTLAQAALLAGLLKAPSRLSPLVNIDGAQERALSVLTAMRSAGFIDDRQAAKALSMQAETARSYWSGSQHYVADMVMKRLPTLVGDIQQDLVVETTLDMRLQDEASRIIRDTTGKNGAKHNIGQGALVALSASGEIRALVGGRDYGESQFNRAVYARRQPGSAFKPIVYLAALEAGRTPQSVRMDAAVRIGDWTPENYDREYRGEVTLRTALANSLNTIAVQLVMEVGPKTVVETAYRLGIRTQLQRNASVALGTSEVPLIELTTAYAPFANGGYRVTPWLIERVRTRSGKVLYQHRPEEPVQVVRPRELAMMNDMLIEAVRNGTGHNARLSGWQFAGKTGTTQNSRDALFVGYTADMVAAVWYGNDDGSPMKKVTGGTLPATSWSAFMATAHSRVPPAFLAASPAEEIAAVPAFRPGLADNSETPNRRAPRPGAEIGRSERPRSIMDLLFGIRRPG